MSYMTYVVLIIARVQLINRVKVPVGVCHSVVVISYVELGE